MKLMFALSVVIVVAMAFGSAIALADEKEAAAAATADDMNAVSSPIAETTNVPPIDKTEPSTASNCRRDSCPFCRTEAACKEVGCTWRNVNGGMCY